jgi:DNA-binding IclR family transcriptional regulator
VSSPITSDQGTRPSGDVVALGRHSSGDIGGVRASRETRGLSTARAVLKVLSFMAQHPDGVRAREVADELGKSVSTAYYLLASLHEEGFAVHEPGRGYRLRPEAALGSGVPARSPDHSLSRTVDELFARTHRRSYLGQIEAGAIVITAACGRQGIPRVPGLGPRIDRSAHALAMGKVVLSLLPEHGRRRYIERGLRRYTPRTITSPSALMSELALVRRNGFAVDLGEFDLDYVTVAAPVLGERGRFLAVLGVSTSSRTFQTGVDDLAREVRDVALAVGGRDARRSRGDAAEVHIPPRRAA